MPTWTSPHTWVDGELVGASGLNTHVRDNLNALMNPNNFNLQTNAAFSTTATTFITLTSTALVVQGGGPVLIGGRFSILVSNFNTGMVVLDVDGTQSTIYSGGNSPSFVGFSELWTGLTVASHTISLKWKVAIGTVTAWTTGGTNILPNTPLTLYAIEL